MLLPFLGQDSPWDKNKSIELRTGLTLSVKPARWLGGEAPYHCCPGTRASLAPMAYGSAPRAEDVLRNGPARAFAKMRGPVLIGNCSLGNAMRKQKGFSLIELLLVVAIILIIAAIAIPNMLRARIAANEASAAAAIRSITAAETMYFSAYPDIGYAVQIQDLGRTAPCVPAPTHACLLDNNLANAVPGSGGHSGYQFLATGISSGAALNSAFVAGATPVTPNGSGSRDFCSVADGVLRNQPTAGGVPPNTIPPCLAYPVAQY
jgi:type IV pilus assembly protein PilA